MYFYSGSHAGHKHLKYNIESSMFSEFKTVFFNGRLIVHWIILSSFGKPSSYCYIFELLPVFAIKNNARINSFVHSFYSY